MEDESCNLPRDGIFSVFAEQNLLILIDILIEYFLILGKTVATRLYYNVLSEFMALAKDM